MKKPSRFCFCECQLAYAKLLELWDPISDSHHSVENQDEREECPPRDVHYLKREEEDSQLVKQE